MWFLLETITDYLGMYISTVYGSQPTEPVDVDKTMDM